MGLKYISVLFIYEIRTIVTKLSFTLRCPLFTVSHQCYDFDLTVYFIYIQSINQSTNQIYLPNQHKELH